MSEAKAPTEDRQFQIAKIQAERRELVEYDSETGDIRLRNLDQAVTFAKHLVDTNSAPKGATTGSIVASIQAGAEIKTPARPRGLGIMQSIQLIPCINGRPFIMGDLARALIQESGLLEPGTMIEEWFSGTPFEPDWTAHIRTHRKGDPKPVEHTFSWAEAKRADLTTKSGPWKQYPQRQMKYRALGFHFRDQYSGVSLGLHTFEEGLDMPQATMRSINAPPPEKDPLFDSPGGEKEDEVGDAVVVENGGVIDAEWHEAAPESESPGGGQEEEVGDAAPSPEEPALPFDSELGHPTRPCDQDPSCVLGEGHTAPCEPAEED